MFDDLYTAPGEETKVSTTKVRRQRQFSPLLKMNQVTPNLGSDEMSFIAAFREFRDHEFAPLQHRESSAQPDTPSDQKGFHLNPLPTAKVSTAQLTNAIDARALVQRKEGDGQASQEESRSF